ncbi:NAD(P)H-dependent oxidoreductase [Bacillus timonensis]|nr:NAD(P)H-dependent oxidoreductase [Bacillus timonensis]
MNHLIVFTHPDKNSFNGALLERYGSELQKKGHNVKIRDLYRLNFYPALSREEYLESFNGKYKEDVKIEHSFIDWSDIITFINPIWWAGIPALTKGYMDRIFSYGFAYTLDKGTPVPLLGEKKAITIFTGGQPENLYRENGMLKSMRQIIEEGLFEFCGLQNAGSLYFGNIIMASNEERKEMLDGLGVFANQF